MHLLAAINCMTDVASAINEFKRRKDLGEHQILYSVVYSSISLWCMKQKENNEVTLFFSVLFSVRKYREDSDTKLSDKFAKLNVHSTKKKLARLSQKMVGIQVSQQGLSLMLIVLISYSLSTFIFN